MSPLRNKQIIQVSSLMAFSKVGANVFDLPVCSGGLQGFRPRQVSTASASLPWGVGRGVFAFSAISIKVRSPAASAEMTRQAEFPRWALTKLLMPESPRTPAHGRRRLVSWRSPRHLRRSRDEPPRLSWQSSTWFRNKQLNTNWTCSCYSLVLGRTATLAGQPLSNGVVQRLMVGPRPSHSSSHCFEQRKGCRVGHGTAR